MVRTLQEVRQIYLNQNRWSEHLDTLPVPSSLYTVPKKTSTDMVSDQNFGPSNIDGFDCLQLI